MEAASRVELENRGFADRERYYPISRHLREPALIQRPTGFASVVETRSDPSRLIVRAQLGHSDGRGGAVTRGAASPRRKHLQRYITEFAGKHNARPADTEDQMIALTYRDLIAPNGLPSGARS